ncbi:alpha/beta fold hydrolase [Roseateles amylovorans]|uniref:Alpha/beta fold hydrolase n=1 Tax=Roseateles amylovorans TaxID=2978473 RepID=A0ABY6AYE0_9BURK|nr:alpha/beta fold hydrolase [Roseateles amylovorans]UXH77933.1 alpha/beta fold hydrolase [Roseateles amylovorans]
MTFPDDATHDASEAGTNIVLVHGAWGGAWVWRRVLGPLRAAGHRVFTVSLSGTGERAHQSHRDLTLQTHIDDVKAVIECEELQRVLLVGHSYSGMVITGVADQMPDRMTRLVYLDAVVPLPGEAWSSRHTPQTQVDRRDLIARYGHLPPAPPTGMGLNADDFDWVARRQRPHPGGVYDSPLQFDADAWRRLPRTFIDCNRPALLTIAGSRERVRQQGDWDLHQIPTGHNAMISADQALLDILLRLAASTAPSQGTAAS